MPGCAVFGCADDGSRALPTEAWPEAHALVLRGMRWITVATLALQAVPLTFALAFGMVLAGASVTRWTFLPFGLASLVTLVAMERAFAVKHEVQRRGYGGMLSSAGHEAGDRRLARAVAERTGRTLPVPPAVSAVGLTLALMGALLGSGSQVLNTGLVALACMFGVLFYVALGLPRRWVGYQRILANRLGAAVEASQPRKPLPPGE